MVKYFCVFFLVTCYDTRNASIHASIKGFNVLLGKSSFDPKDFIDCYLSTQEIWFQGYRVYVLGDQVVDY